ncbi:MAG: hypothetical protein A3A28_00365 [Candidatus Sungbacteria bacterium RIFCSPLOWO2_01_FULL_47_32]|uniref:MaoC-like domain-containing protein n=1 Tax=Candidatus Sungbacteria bacterium RIFCSPHIGHO2_01_FULL_47_32 TaxID=1802264 RepID=A0A1G2K6Q8_9BACT|nr:MAG: dehydratase [Parcubacteria group bacterium GW2011_GWA2_47_10]OGZ95129.1 MAG: hypothetical protein A2633_06370 [Candidatus Sungbacteria bacterium RIFCSPHIGHO2_01_FULL_47_32]OGZ98202.1 MAG: hypothetical protein A3D57_03235 [Candidatus Sungbacteria bacterium RIFCSPHIGHO2_02_FULL_46_12]OHA05609.1 MAG: hypothetical protein A3A28_00365 [Candidatus Sungbacteria bacterium RIFCSPLOWO2_01_FULL_47_32]
MTHEYTPNTYVFDELTIGQSYEFTRVIKDTDIKIFSELTGDRNPLHVDSEYARTTQFGGVVAHGMLVSSLFSTLVGMYLPGKYCLYLSQDLQFRNPLRPNEEVRVHGKIISKHASLRIIEIRTVVFGANDKVMVDGLAKVKVLK